MESRLDVLLEVTRDEPPADDAFVDAVMTKARADVANRRRFVRLLTGPTAVAAAAVIALGAGFAALVRSTSPSPERPQQALHTDAPTIGRGPSSTEGRGEAGGERGGVSSPTQRSGDLEWGYESDASAFALDRSTGLRLETTLSATEFDAGVPQRITLTLRNTSKRAVAVSSLDGCALMVRAYPTGEATDDNRDAVPWQCATSRDGPSGAFVLKPNGQHVADATVVLGAPGEWSIVGMCRCTHKPAEDGMPEKDPRVLEGLTQLGADLPGTPGTDRPAETPVRGLVTPPIRVEAR